MHATTKACRVSPAVAADVVYPESAPEGRAAGAVPGGRLCRRYPPTAAAADYSELGGGALMSAQKMPSLRMASTKSWKSTGLTT